MATQIRSAGESPGRRFKRRRKRKRGKRGAVSERRGRDKAVEGKTRQKRDRSERPGDRKFKKSAVARSRKRKPLKRKQRQGSDKKGRGDFGRDRPERGPDKQRLGGIREEINAIKERRASFSERRPEQVAADRGFDPERLKGLPGGAPGGAPDNVGQGMGWNGRQPTSGQPQPTNLDQVNAYDAPPVYAQPQPAPAPGVQIGPDGRVIQPAPGVQPQPGVGVQPQPAPGVVPGGEGVAGGVPGGAPPIAGTYTPPDQPGPTSPPGIATDTYGQPVGGGAAGVAPQPQPFQAQPAPFDQMNPRAAGMDRFAQPPQPRRPEGVQYQ